MISPLTTPRDLAALLGTSYSNLIYVVYKNNIDKSYTKFSIPKKNGKTREICSPNPQLKSLQRRLAHLLNRLYDPHKAAAAFIEKRGIIYNAEKHIKKEVVFNIDLQNFFSEINFGRVRGLLISKPYCLQPKTATLIANICCTENKVPQGSPTSPVISNMICRKIDRELSQLAKDNKSTYSRYADDITFSWRVFSENGIVGIDDTIIIGDTLKKIIDGNGFSINDEKTRVQFSNEKQTVTGLTVNKKINIDRRYIRKTRAMIHSLSFGKDLAQEKFESLNIDTKSKVENVALGRLLYIHMVKGRESSTYQTLAKKFNSLSLDLKAPIYTTSFKNLDEELKFNTPRKREYIEDRVWVVDFEDVNASDEFIIGSAFMLKNNKVVTCNHLFDKAGNTERCRIYRVNDTSNKFFCKRTHEDKHSDIAILEIEADLQNQFPYFKVTQDPSKHSGYKVSILGFPQYQLGHKSVTAIPSTIINEVTLSAVQHFEVDTTIMADNSGGPVVNALLEVLGIAKLGTSVNAQTEKNKLITTLEGNNLFVSATHIPS